MALHAVSSAVPLYLPLVAAREEHLIPVHVCAGAGGDDQGKVMSTLSRIWVCRSVALLRMGDLSVRRFRWRRHIAWQPEYISSELMLFLRGAL